jgi:hypothetical protein
MQSSTTDAVIGLAFYVLLAGVGVVSIGAMTVHCRSRLRAHGVSERSLDLATVVVALTALVGGWIVFDAYWLVGQLGSFVARIRRAPDSADVSSDRSRLMRWFRVLVVAFAAAFVVLEIIQQRGSNHDRDIFTVRFHNDLSTPIVLALCDSSATCSHPYYRDRIPSGESHPANISADLPTEWAVETEGGQLLRCINLYWKTYPGHTPDVLLSSAPRWSMSCPSS